jgi:hypothetical protein
MPKQSAIDQALLRIRRSDYKLHLSTSGRYCGNAMLKRLIVGKRGFVRSTTLKAMFDDGLVKLVRPREFHYELTLKGKIRSAKLYRSFLKRGK